MTFSEDEIYEIVQLLDVPCWRCGGVGGECDACDGNGYRLTAAGAALLKFIRRHTQEQP